MDAIEAQGGARRHILHCGVAKVAGLSDHSFAGGQFALGVMQGNAKVVQYATRADGGSSGLGGGGGGGLCDNGAARDGPFLVMLPKVGLVERIWR